MATDRDAAFRQRVRNLPQELLEEVYHWTFTASPGVRVFAISPRPNTKAIATTIPFPSALHVSRASREMFARSYYGSGVFVSHDVEKAVVRCWLDLVAPEHRLLIPELRIALGCRNRYVSRDFRAFEHPRWQQPEISDSALGPSSKIVINYDREVSPGSVICTAVVTNVDAGFEGPPSTTRNFRHPSYGVLCMPYEEDQLRHNGDAHCSTRERSAALPVSVLCTQSSSDGEDSQLALCEEMQGLCAKVGKRIWRLEKVYGCSREAE